MKRLPAFTILEVMMAMTITAIVVTLSFSGLRLVQLQFRQFTDQQAKVEAARRGITLLKWDFARSRYVLHQGEQLVCWQAMDTITYVFSPTALIRSYGMQQEDSFPVSLSIQQSSFNQQIGEGLIDQITFKVALTDFAKTVDLNKTYSAHDLILWDNEH